MTTEEIDFKQIDDQFFDPDKIDKIKFFANFQIIKNEGREIYKKIAKLHNEEDYSSHGTPSIDSLTFTIDQPLGYYRWFIAAYPDVVKWTNLLETEDLVKIIGNPKENDLLDKEDRIKFTYLRKIVDAFKGTGKKLECAL